MGKVQIATRRDLLRQGLGIVGIGAVLPQFLMRSALAGVRAGSDQRIVVSLLLTGGHDGLSGVPPYAHEDYYRYRKVTRIDEKDVLKLNEEVGLHPEMGGLRDMFDDGAMAVVLGTGYPNYNLSHFVSRDIWEAARQGSQTGRPGSTGWLGRYLDHACKGVIDPKLGLAVGHGRLPLVITGEEHPGLGFSSPDSFRFRGGRSAKDDAAYRRLTELTSYPPEDRDLQFLTRTALHANSASQEILEKLASYQTEVSYPDTDFGNSLRTIAALIGQGLTTRVYYAAQGIAQFGGYDTHAEQKPRHAELVRELCECVCAFYADLKRQGNAERVLTFTFSDFGRRVPENHSGGTDHGLAGPMFLFGPGVKAGVHGKQPSLKDLDENDNLKMQVDFRSVYAAILERWLGTESEPILGERYPLIDCVRG